MYPRMIRYLFWSALAVAIVSCDQTHSADSCNGEPADSCPSSCVGLNARYVRSASGCLDPLAIVACGPQGVTGLGIATCMVRARDESVFLFPADWSATLTSSGWRRCSAAERLGVPTSQCGPPRTDSGSTDSGFPDATTTPDTDPAGDAPALCSRDSSNCPETCLGLEARLGDGSRSCLNKFTIVACAPMGSTGLGVSTCLVRKRDGALHWFSADWSYVSTSDEWRRCTAEERAAIPLSSPACSM